MHFSDNSVSPSDVENKPILRAVLNLNSTQYLHGLWVTKPKFMRSQENPNIAARKRTENYTVVKKYMICHMDACAA